MLFYFCIMVHNGAGHILLFDFLWAHLNLLDWSIKSSGPIYKCKGILFFLGAEKRACTAQVLRAHTN